MSILFCNFAVTNENKTNPQDQEWHRKNEHTTESSISTANPQP